MASSGGIKWKRGDYIKLGRAISEFNKKIKDVETLENKSYLPEMINYQDIKSSIATRKEFNRYINSLKRFQKEGQEKLYETEAGEIMTVWERRNLQSLSRRSVKSLQQELDLLNEPLNGAGFSRVQMGSVRAKELEAQIKNLKSIENVSGYEFQRLKRRLENMGRSDYEYRKATTYRENYLKEMEKYQNFENYGALKKKLNEIKDPIKFFDFVSQTEITGDLTYNSDMYYSQGDFNYFLEQLGVEFDVTNETI